MRVLRGEAMTVRVTLADRIEAALKARGGRMTYWDLAKAVFPNDRFPRAWLHATRGGPPGCYMTLSRCLNANPERFDVALYDRVRGKFLHGPYRIISLKRRSA